MTMQEFKNLDELIESILEPKSPQLPAITDADKTIFWQELPELINSWLRKAKDAGINQQNPVILFGHKEAEYVVAIAACFVAGIVYIPVDKAFPEERINKISNIANASHLYRADLDAFVENKQFDTGLSLKEKDLAYIMFTSGSTGEPKGVQIGRESVLGLINWSLKDFAFSENPVIMNQVHFSFDVSMFDSFTALASAGHILLNSKEEIVNKNIWFNKLAKHKVESWVSTPAFAYQQILNKEFSSEYLPSLKTFILAGEPLTLTFIKRLKTLFPDARIINAYGPTEATVLATKIEVDLDQLENSNIPIGYPMPGTRVEFIENDELVIVGDNVMRGYLNREDLNSTKLFVDDKTGLRAFKTGDAGYKKIFNDKELIYCTGRLDSQIKLHGYRIELDEIESNLDAIDDIHKSVILPLKKADGSVLRILAFYICLPDVEKIESDFLKKRLSVDLPEYMIPSEFICLKEFPTNTNNKIDRKAILNDYLDRA